MIYRQHHQSSIPACLIHPCQHHPSLAASSIPGSIIHPCQYHPSPPTSSIPTRIIHDTHLPYFHPSLQSTAPFIYPIHPSLAPYSPPTTLCAIVLISPLPYHDQAIYTYIQTPAPQDLPVL